MKKYTVLLLALIVVIFFTPAIFFNKRIFQYDMSLMLYPYLEFSGEMLNSGRLPGWNPYLFCGFPLLAANQAGVFYPFYLFGHFIFQTFDLYTFTIIFHFFLNLSFTYLFLSVFELSRFARIFGALAFAFGGFMTAHHSNIGIICARSWLPLILYLYFIFN